MKHLRVGSYLIYNGVAKRLDNKSLSNILIYGTKGYKPIRITEDVLLLCGFYKVKGEYNTYQIRGEKVRMIGGYLFYANIKQGIKSLHVLQNIFLYLYSIELEYMHND